MRHEDPRKKRWPSVLWISAILFGSLITAVYSFRHEIKEALIRRVIGDVIDDIGGNAVICIRCQGSGSVSKRPVRSMLPFGEESEKVKCPLCGGSGKAPAPWD